MWNDDECEHGSSGFCHQCCHEEEYHGGKRCDCGNDKDKNYDGPRFAGDEVYGYGDWDG